MNLEVDVMEGDRFVASGALVWQKRIGPAGLTGRLIEIGRVNDFHPAITESPETPLDLAAFTRYCEGCGLTVKMVKPEPKVETIKPPEWGVVFVDGRVELHTTQSAAETWKERSAFVGRIVRIDWGAK